MNNLLRPAATFVLLALTAAATAAPHSPKIVAHRGLLRHSPENTLANFRACLELRLGFEFDVERTKDGHLVCIHDGTVDRTTNGSGKVADFTLAQIQKLDAGSWFDTKFAGEKVPSIDEVMRLIAEYRENDVLIAVDIKASGVERDVVQLARKHKVLHRLLFIGRTIVEPRVRANLKAASKEATTAAVANNSEEFPAALADTSADWVYVRFLASKEQIDAVHRAGKRAFIAGPTVGPHQPENWTHAAEVGIDAILTDYAFQLRTVVRKRVERE